MTIAIFDLLDATLQRVPQVCSVPGLGVETPEGDIRPAMDFPPLGRVEEHRRWHMRIKSRKLPPISKAPCEASPIFNPVIQA